jgi:hypothetical protein
MKFTRALIYIAIAIIASGIFGSGINADTGDDSSERTQILSQDGISDRLSGLNSTPDNNSCQDAVDVMEVRTDWDMYSEHNELKISGMMFTNGNDVDDWYIYTVWDIFDCPYPDEPYIIRIGLGSDIEDLDRLNVELYEECDGHPIAQGEEHPADYIDEIQIDFTSYEAGKTYYIHVNLIDPPESGAVTYNLYLQQYCGHP